MLSITKQYRKDYLGEDIITERTYKGGKWYSTTENVPNAVTNTQLSNRAVIIGNGPNRLGFDLRLLKKPSGLLGALTVQTYGCNALYREYTPDFLIACGSQGIIDEIASSGYTTDNIVYSNSIHLLEHPGKFYLIPYDPYADAGTAAAYVAAFDGHKKIYLIGFDGHDTPGINNNVYANTNGYDARNVDYEIEDYNWRASLKALVDTYDDVDFVWVTPYGRNIISQRLKSCSNFRQISFRDFVLECDL